MDKVTAEQCPQTTAFLERKESRSGIEPRSFRLTANALPLSQTGSREEQMMMKCCLMSSDVSWHIRNKLWPMPKHGSIILYVHGNQRLVRTATSTLTQLLNYDRNLMMMNWCLMSSDVMRHIRDKLWPMPKHGAINLYVHGNQKAR